MTPTYTIDPCVLLCDNIAVTPLIAIRVDTNKK
jgi:hypothetical protein